MFKKKSVNFEYFSVSSFSKRHDYKKMEKIRAIGAILVRIVESVVLSHTE